MSAKNILDERLARGDISHSEYDALLVKISPQSNTPEEALANVPLSMPKKYEHTKITVGFLDKFNSCLGAFLLILSVVQSNGTAFLFSIFVIGSVILRLSVFNTVSVEVLSGNTWVNIGQYTYEKAKSVAQQLSSGTFAEE